MNMRILRIAMIVAFVCVCAQVACAADPLLVQVSCQGCSNKVSISDGYKFYADAGKSVTLTASSTGGDGSKRHSWTKDGIAVCNRASFQLTVAEDSVEYILIVADDGGRVSKVVQITPNSIQKSECLPDFRGGITIDDETKGRREWVEGDTFILEVKLVQYDECPNAEIYWKTDNQDIILTSLSEGRLMKTRVEIRKGAVSGISSVVRAVITDGTVIRDCEIEIKIVSNTPPSKVEIEYDELVSYTDFKVYCVDFKTGESRNEYEDFVHRVSVVLKNETGRIIDSASKTVTKEKSRDREIPYLKVKSEGTGIYFIEYTVEDSHGLTSTVNETIEVKIRGSTGKDIPTVDVPDVIYCTVGEVCKIKTISRRDRSAVGFEYWIVHEGKRIEQLSSSISGGFCTGPECSKVFEYVGTYTIEVEAKYFDINNRRESKAVFKIVTVIVSSGNVSAVSTPVPTPTPTPVFIPTVIRTSVTEEPETEKGGWKKILSDIFDIIDKVKNALNL